MDVISGIAAVSAGGVVALAAGRWLLGLVLDLAFRSAGRSPAYVKKPAGA